MKPPGPLNSGKGFKPRSTRLKATGAKNRAAELSRGAAKPKPRKPLKATPKPVTPEERMGRRLLKVRSGAICEMDGPQPRHRGAPP